MPSCDYCGFDFGDLDKPEAISALAGRAECPSCGASNPRNAHDTGR